ncbi:MAG: hypothetical protein NC419_00735 [Muribaculaceae bacterium]|nr:hypothetical protein [Muribaculaceae bacterium]
MKMFQKSRGIFFVAVALCGAALLCSCGKQDGAEEAENLVNIQSDTADSIDAGEDYGGLSASEGMESYEEDGGDIASGNTNTIGINFTGDAAGLNGKIRSMAAADTDWIIAETTEGKLFLLQPFIDYYMPEDSEIKSHEIADGCMIDDLVYAGQHLAYGQNQLIYFEMIGEYDENVDRLDSLELPEYVYTAENVKQVELEGAQDLLWVGAEADCIAYAGADGHVCVSYKGDTYADVGITAEDDAMEDTAVRKGIYSFVLTEKQKLLYVTNVSTSGSFGGTVEAVSLECRNLTDKIGSQAADIYNLQNYEDACYVVDEDNYIYYVEDSWLEDDLIVELITQFENGVITDIQGFAGEYENILIQTDDGSYYYSDSNGNIVRIEELDETYQNAVLLMDNNIIALGTDGCLYLIVNQAAE